MLMAATIVQMERDLRRLPMLGDPERNFARAMAGRRYSDARTDDGGVLPGHVLRFQPLPSTPERHLWVEVVLRAVEDSQGRGPALTPFDIEQAKRWLDVRNSRFRQICELADFAPEYVIRAADAKKNGTNVCPIRKAA